MSLGQAQNSKVPSPTSACNVYLCTNKGSSSSRLTRAYSVVVFRYRIVYVERHLVVNNAGSATKRCLRGGVQRCLQYAVGIVIVIADKGGEGGNGANSLGRTQYYVFSGRRIN